MRFMVVIGVIVAALLVVPVMASALGGSGARVKGVISHLLTGDVVTGGCPEPCGISVAVR